MANSLLLGGNIQCVNYQVKLNITEL